MALVNLTRLGKSARNCKSIAHLNHRQMSYGRVWDSGYNCLHYFRYGICDLGKGDAWTTKHSRGTS
jgi:hypothetical protein